MNPSAGSSAGAFLCVDFLREMRTAAIVCALICMAAAGGDLSRALDFANVAQASGSQQTVTGLAPYRLMLPFQSANFQQATCGNGSTTRRVMLPHEPHEPHGYTVLESYEQRGRKCRPGLTAASITSRWKKLRPSRRE
ncbi:MAG: hypothetical protein ACOH1V_00440 [Stenotrophomonas sp.]